MQRYTIKGWDGVAVESDDGEFVRWDDVDARDVERLAECVAKLDREASLTAERDALRARVAELEAPPVVPEGCKVLPSSVQGEWRTEFWGDARWRRVAMHRALAWALEHNQRPPHAGDE